MFTLPKSSSSRRVSAREKRGRRNSSASKTRVSSASPLPSLAETEDNQSTDSFPLFPRGRTRDETGSHVYDTTGSHVTDPLCVSTPKSYARVKTKEADVDKRGTLTSVSSGSSSSASPPSSSETSHSREAVSEASHGRELSRQVSRQSSHGREAVNIEAREVSSTGSGQSVSRRQSQTSKSGSHTKSLNR